MQVSLTVQILAMGLTISQLIAGKVENFQTSFKPGVDNLKVAKLLRAGCDEGLKDDGNGKPLDIDPILGAFVEDDTSAPSIQAPGAAPAQGAIDPTVAIQAKIAKFDFNALRQAYREYCQPRKRYGGRHHDVRRQSPTSAINLAKVIEYYNSVFKVDTDVSVLKNYRFGEATSILNLRGEKVTSTYTEGNNRKFVPINLMAPHVVQAFISAEDKDFYNHKGVDMRGIIRAAFSSMTATDGKRAAGGSTIAQQLIKNIFKAPEYTFERKMREMYMASKAEALLGDRQRIMELYLNEIPFISNVKGVEMAAQFYFGKTTYAAADEKQQITISQAAELAAMNKGPAFYNPYKSPKRLALVEDRRQYVLGRMAEDAFDTSGMKYKDGIHLRQHFKHAREQLAAINKAKLEKPYFRPLPPPTALYFVDQVNRQVRALRKEKPELADFEKGGFVVNSTIDEKIQYLAERSVQNGLANFERTADNNKGRAVFQGAVGSIAKWVDGGRPWKEVIIDARADVYIDVHWPLVAALPATEAACGKTLAIGLKDGTTACLNAGKHDVTSLKPYDLIFADRDAKGTWNLLVPPSVQGAMVVLENKTGRVLGLVGGFSYGASQLNRATRTARPPGSTIKPFTYLYMLNRDYQPNTLISDTPKTIPPIRPGGQPWNPRNYDRNSGGFLTARAALENSINVATANAMAAIPRSAAESLSGICDLTVALGIYATCEKEFPFILGTQPARLIDMAQAYATIANLGLRPTPYLLDSIERNGKKFWFNKPFANKPVKIADRISFYQLRRMMEGVVQRGTAGALAKEFGAQKTADGNLTSTLLAAKTGTSQSEADAWFIGFTNDYTVATWVGYDNPDGKHRRTLGKGQTGGKTAMPIAVEVLRYLKKVQGPQMKPLAAPPAEIENYIGEQWINATTGEVDERNGDLLEVFRLEKDGSLMDTRLKMSGQNFDLATPAPDGDERTEGEETEEAAPNTKSEYNYEPSGEQHYQPPRQEDLYRNDSRGDSGYEYLQNLQRRYGR